MFVDVHAHLDDGQYAKDLPEVISRAEAAGVKFIVNNGVDIASNRKTLLLSKKYGLVKPALGLYPGVAQDMSWDDIHDEIKFIRKQKPFAIGEVGLDYYHEHDAKKQKEVFLEFISLAERLDVPLIVHSRKAERDIVDMLISSRLKKVVLHCFCGKMKIALDAEKHGFFFSVPPIVNSSTQFQELVSRISISSILTETDSPYLSDVKGERNEPKNVTCTVKKISGLKNLDEFETRNLIFMNFQKIF